MKNWTVSDPLMTTINESKRIDIQDQLSESDDDESSSNPAQNKSDQEQIIIDDISDHLDLICNPSDEQCDHLSGTSNQKAKRIMDRMLLRNRSALLLCSRSGYLNLE